MQVVCLVKPKSKVDKISLNADGSLRVKIRALPVEGEANEYLMKYLAEFFDLPRNCIQIISGFTNSHKRVNIVAQEAYVKNIISKIKP